MAQDKKLSAPKEEAPDPEMLKALGMLEKMEVLKMMSKLKMLKPGGKVSDKRSQK